MSFSTTSFQYECISSAPCFARESTYVCRLLASDASPSAAYGDCFGNGAHGIAEKVLMSSLQAGDNVLSAENEVSRVIANQHAEVSMYTRMINIKHSAGSLDLTPDHVLQVDGKLAPARDVVVGSILDGGKVESLSYSTDAIINALTTSGRILVAGPEGFPVVATHAPEWLAPVMLSSAGLFLTRYSLSTTLSHIFPETVQTFYNQHLEAFFAGHHASLDSIVQSMPLAALIAVVAAFDVALASAFVAYKFGSAILVIAALAFAVRKTRKA